MHLFRSALLAEAYGHHFARPAFYGTAKSVMGFETTGKNHAISLKGVLVHVNGLSQFAGPQQHGVHGRKNRAAHALFRDAVPCQHFTLTFTCCTAVAAHCGHNKGQSFPGFDPCDDGTGNYVHVTDAAASCCYCDAHTGFDAVCHAGTGNFVKDSFFDIFTFNMSVRKFLGCAEHTGNRNVLEQP